MLTGLKNISLSGMPFSVSILVPFLGMARQFTGNVNNLAQQFNAIVMAGAGAARVFALVDEKPEADDGYVTLVNVKTGAKGELVETEERTGAWAWRHPHTDGTLTLTPLRGDVRMTNVDFAYVEGKDVLHDVTVYAEPGQQVAFVGATGAGKTTITNLINRFYDIADGKIRYDGININNVAPGCIETIRNVAALSDPAYRKKIENSIPVGYIGQPDEIAATVLLLCSAEGGYITGTDIPVDGGMSIPFT